jgi:hypothetical protein
MTLRVQHGISAEFDLDRGSNLGQSRNIEQACLVKCFGQRTKSVEDTKLNPFVKIRGLKNLCVLPLGTP